ncbi:hypothetical protein OPQ81_000370 [Rhizoctonia solani]|nr:hypothetical protein OPQ81_000370 [Rhizoctonia solani]
MPKLSPAKVNNVLALLDEEIYSYPQICARTGVSIASISCICSKHCPDHLKSTGGCPRKLNPAATHYAVRLVTNHNSVSTQQATQTLCELTGESISPRTVCRALHRSGLKAVKKVKKPKLTRAHIKARIEFAEAHKDWTVEDWKHVLWSDETKINRLWSDGVHWAWARPGEGLSDRLIVPTANFGGGSLMFWGCMGWNGTGHGTKIDSRLNKELYVEILADEFLDSLEYLGMEQERVIFQHDNARPHKAKMTQKWLEENGIECLKWPANSPDLNPIENLWAELKRRLGEYETPPSGILELWERVQDVWNGLEWKYCRNLIESMPRRMALVLERRGKAIPY